MTTITINRATVEQALEALNSVEGKLWKPWSTDAARAADALRAALAQQAEPPGSMPQHERLKQMEAQRQAEPVEPVAWVRLEAWKSGQSWPDDCFTALPAEGLTPLYTAPPQRKPLTVTKMPPRKLPEDNDE